MDIKKILLSIAFVIGIWVLMDCKSYGLELRDPDYNLPTDNMRIESYAKGSKYGTGGDYNSVHKYVLIVSTNSMYNRQGMGAYIHNEYDYSGGHVIQLAIFNQYDLFNHLPYEAGEQPFAHWVEYEIKGDDNSNIVSTHEGDFFNGGSNSGYGQFYASTEIEGYPMRVTSGVLFENQISAYNYLEYGDQDGIISGTSDIENAKPIIWDDGSPYYGTYNEDIPAPKWNVSGSQSGNITKTITFTNAEYDPRAQDGRYGIVLSLKWGSVNEFVLNHDGGLFSKNYSVYYNSSLNYGSMVDIYMAPTKKGDIVYTPQSIMFAQNDLSVQAFNSYLSNNPVANRDITVPNDMADTALTETFQNYIAKPNCPYNTLIFTCCYYKQLSNGKYAFGPYSTGTFNPPSQGAIFSVGNLTQTDQGNMTDGNGGGSSGESENGSWNQNWGNNTPDINYGQNADPQQLIDNVNGLFGLVGQMPSFVAQLISFLPDWILQFIAVSLGLAIAIGVVKLFIG